MEEKELLLQRIEDADIALESIVDRITSLEDEFVSLFDTPIEALEKLKGSRQTAILKEISDGEIEKVKKIEEILDTCDTDGKDVRLLMAIYSNSTERPFLLAKVLAVLEDDEFDTIYRVFVEGNGEE